MNSGVHRLSPMLVCALLVACGGGGEDGSSPPPSGNIPPTFNYTPGIFQAASTFADRCQAPRTGTDPLTNRPYADVRGSTLEEKHFLRSWTNELYLWFSEVPERDPASIADVLDYFDVLKTNAVMPSGTPKDQFHFTYDTDDYIALAGSGVAVGYGIAWGVIQPTPSRRIVVLYVQAGSAAATQGVQRGDELLIVDGVDVVNVNTQVGVNAITAAMYPERSGETHALTFRKRGTATQAAVTLAASAVTYDPVPVTRVLPTVMGNVGYLLFNDHVATSEQALVHAVNQLRTASVQDLVLDLRYNGGGYLDIASELAFMIAGTGPTAGRVFERLRFSSKHPATNPVTGRPLEPTPFHTRTQGFSVNQGQNLPTQNLPRVFVITGEQTCSASESIINGLRGVGVTVYLIGGETCGKPYGFYPEDNCGTTYFSIQFQGVNEAGFGDYAEGFSARTRVGDNPQARLPGCPSGEDFTTELGDTNERLLRVALTYRDTGGSCQNTLPLAEPLRDRMRAMSASEQGVAVRAPEEPLRSNRILR